MKPLLAILFCLSVGMGQDYEYWGKMTRLYVYQRDTTRAKKDGYRVVERVWSLDAGMARMERDEPNHKPKKKPKPKVAAPVTLEDWQEYVASCEPSPRDIEDSLRTLIGRIRNFQSRARSRFDGGIYVKPGEIESLLAPMGYRKTPSWEGFAEWLIKRREKKP